MNDFDSPYRVRTREEVINEGGGSLDYGLNRLYLAGQRLVFVTPESEFIFLPIYLATHS